MSATGAIAGGLLLIDKPSGWTSHDCVAALRRRFPRGMKVGHAGTLDPAATGLLLVLLGPVTRLQSRFQSLGKVYRGVIRFGFSTETGDLEGKVTARTVVPELTPEQIQAAMSSFIGEVSAPAPAYSAVKHEGRPLYRYARAGLEIPVKMRTTRVEEWQLKGWTTPDAEYRLSCSSGTYVRTLAQLLGEKLGSAAVVAQLTRESVGRFHLDHATALKTILDAPAATLEALLSQSRAELATAFMPEKKP